MNTAIEATYNINVPPAVSLARRAPPLASISLPPTLSRGSIQNGHINLIISSVIRLADEERLGTDVGYPYQEWCQCSLLCSLCYARLGPAPRRSSDGGKSADAVVVFVVIVLSTRRVFSTIGLLVNFQSAYSHPPLASDRVNLDGHVFGHAIAITCHETSYKDRGVRSTYAVSYQQRLIGLS